MTFSGAQERIERRRELDEKFEEIQRVIGTDNDLIQIEYRSGGRNYTGRLVDFNEENLIFDENGRKYYFPKNFIDPDKWKTVKKKI